jgi:hypothetical protein
MFGHWLLHVPLRYQTRALDLGLAMSRVRAAKRTKFLDHELFCLLLLVLAGRVVTSFTVIARQTDQISHCLSLLYAIL